MADAIDIIDGFGGPRKLGTIPNTPGFLTKFQPYAEAGKPMYSREQIVANAKVRDTRGSSKFDPSWIMDQKSHGSCNGFAAAAASSKSRVRRGLTKVLLSGAFAYSLMNGGRDNGSVLVDGMELIQEHGIATADTVKWNQIYPRQYDKAKANAEAARFKMEECYTLSSELELFSAMAANFDVVVAVDVNDAFMRLDSDGVVGGGRGVGNHSVSADGYWVTAGGVLVADGVNSWNTSYGNQGRMGLTWDRHFAQTVKHHGFYAIRTAIDDPLADNPPPLEN